MSSDIESARDRLRAFVVERSDDLKCRLGIGYRASRYAPTSFDDLRREFRMCRRTGLPIRVSSLHNERTILGRETNLAFRFWHDCTHLELNAGFDHDGEVVVGQEQLRQLEEEDDIEVQSLAWRMLFAETIGQTKCATHLGVFPTDQWRFTLEYLRLGLREAIWREGRRRSVLPLWSARGTVQGPREVA